MRRVEGETSGGMLLDFADLRAQIREVLGPYDHRHWNDVLEYPTVENICQRIATELSRKMAFPFTIRVYEGQGKWAETSTSPVSRETPG